tara:strand:+ start:621 stop:770 length:150 start_codon:yes stop_codon:yes gene_type:complete
MPTPGWGTRPQDIIDEAKARAKAALKEENPKLTSLERAFYEVYKKRQEG